MVYVALLSSIFLVGLILLISGVILLLKVKNKLPGLLAIGAGTLFTVSPIGIVLLLTIVGTTYS